MSYEDELFSYKESFSYKECILEALHESKPKNIFEVMAGRGSWRSDVAVNAMNQLVAEGKVELHSEEGDLYQERYFVSAGKKEVELPKTPQAMREGVENWESGALNSASWAYIEAVHSHTGERLTSDHFNNAKAILRDALLVFFEKYDKDTEERNEPDAQEGKTVKRKLDFS